MINFDNKMKVLFLYEQFYKIMLKTKQNLVSFNMANFVVRLNIVFACCIFAVMLCCVHNAGAQSAKGYGVKKVVIDPGHGGKDPGAVGSFSKEKDITLAVSLKVGNLIKKYFDNVEVIYTRSTDEFVELHKRAKIANDNKADLFICIHVNAIAGGNAYGAETFVMGLNVSEENMRVAKLENSVILKEDNYEKNYDGFDPNCPESNIMFSLYQNAYLEQSLKFSEKVQKNLKNTAGRYDRGVKQAAFLVLWRTTMPAVLIECGFISHKDEEKYMNTEAGQDQMAQAIFDAFKDYKISLENQGNEISGNGDTKTTIKEPVNKESVDNKTNESTTNHGETNSPQKDNAVLNNSANFAQGIYFGVQVKTSAKKIDISSDSFLNKQSNVFEYFHNGLYKYVVALDRNYDVTYAGFTALKSEIKDCFIVAFKNGERYPVTMAQKESKP